MDKSFGDILRNLDFAFMADLQARKGRFGLYSDVTCLGQSATTSVTGPGGLRILEATTTLDA